MRAYFFGNMYLSSIQQGIQAGHVIGDMFVKYMVYDNDPVKLAAVKEWALNHKTMILLNAGYGANIHSLNKMFSSRRNPFPFAMFREEQASLDGAVTSIGIVLPDYIYIGASQLREDPALFGDDKVVIWTDDSGAQQISPTVSTWQIELMVEMGKYGLAS